MLPQGLRPIAACCAALLLLSAAAQPNAGRGEPGTETWRFHHLTIDDGLSQNVAAALLQDRRGFIWIGTKDGLNRYDGVDFAVYRHDPFDTSTLLGDHVTALDEDGGGALWVGTQAGSLTRLDPATGRAVRYRRSPTAVIENVTVGPDGSVWLATRGEGVYRLAAAARDDPEAVFERLPTAPGPASEAADVLVDAAGTVWAATNDGLWRRPAGGRSFARHADGVVGALTQSSDGTLWAGLGDAPRRSVAFARFDAARPGWAERHASVVPLRSGWRYPYDLAEGPERDLWIAAETELYHLDRRTGAVTVTPARPDERLGLQPDEQFGLRPGVLRLLWDRGGVLWVGTNGYGLSRFDARGTRFSLVRRPALVAGDDGGYSVRAIFEARNGDLWTSAGWLYRREAASGRWSRLPRGEVWDLAEDADGRIWTAALDGLTRYDPAQNRIQPFPIEGFSGWGEATPQDQPYDLYLDRRGTLWTVTLNYLLRLDDPEAGRLTAFEHTPADLRPPPVPLFPSLHEDSRGRFWIGTEVGLVHLDPRTGRTRRYRTDPDDPASLRSERIRSILPDPRQPDRVLWIGTAGGGLSRLDLASGRFTHVTTPVLPNDVVYGVLPDGAGRLWLSTNRGLARYDPTTGDVRTFDVNDGLQSNEFNSGAYHHGISGRLYFGGIYGVSAFDPAAVTDNPHRPPTVLTRLTVGGRPVAVGDSTGLLARELWATDALRLGPRQNAFALSFAALDFAAPAKNRYAYRLDGFDDGWVEAGTGRTATYTNVPPGRYTFRVRGTNNDGVWGPETRLAVAVAAPWWRTPWALALWAALAAGAVVGLVRVRRSRVELRHRLELERVGAEQLRALDAAKSRFFADVSHEFRTPLTLTLGPLEDLRRGVHGPLGPSAQAHLDVAIRNGRGLLRLVGQLLDLARLEAGHLRLRRREGDLGAYVHGLAQPFVAAAERRGVGFTVAVPEASVPVAFDTDHLDKVVANLLSNALKFTPVGGRVALTVAVDDGQAVVRVADTGPGIAEAERERLFDRFYQGRTSDVQAGTGIGLSLAKELAELHGGTLAVASPAGEEPPGSVFTLALPLARPVADAAPRPVIEVAPAAPGGDGRGPAGLADAAPTSALEGTGAGPAGDGGPTLDGAPADDDAPTVLVVDDHPEIRAYVRSHLDAAGTLGGSYHVVEAADGAAALAAVRQRLPDAIVSDVSMPTMDGFALLRALRADPETDFVPVVLLTARAEAEDKLAGLGLGADDYVTKPFDARELAARVDNLIAQRRRLRERFADAPADGLARLHPAPAEATDADRAFLAAVAAAVEAGLSDEAFGVTALAEAVAQDRTTLYRRLTALTGEAPAALLRRMRLERGADLLRQRAGTVGEIAYAVGFKSVSHFSSSFREHTGETPTAYARAQAAPAPVTDGPEADGV